MKFIVEHISSGDYFRVIRVSHVRKVWKQIVGIDVGETGNKLFDVIKIQ